MQSAPREYSRTLGELPLARLRLGDTLHREPRQSEPFAPLVPGIAGFSVPIGTTECSISEQ